MKVVEDSGRGSKVLHGLDTTFYRSQEAGDYVVYEFDTDPGEYEVFLRYTGYGSYGTYQVSLDGQPIGEPVDAYYNGLDARGGLSNLGTHAISGNKHRIKLDVTGKNDDAANYFIGVCDLILRPTR
jgi:hypothetical protein